MTHTKNWTERLKNKLFDFTEFSDRGLFNPIIEFITALLIFKNKNPDYLYYLHQSA